MINSLRLQDFRSYHNDSFEFEPGVNIVVGPNASGKTNLLEALLVACLGSSYRARDSELVRHKAPWSRLDAFTSHGTRTVKLETIEGADRVQKSFVLADKTYKRLSLNKTVPVVLFEPDDLRLLTGSPERRREFMDDMLEQMVVGFGQLRRQYKRTLAQRNALLKSGDSHVNTQIFAWNIRLAELGGAIAKERLALVNRINQELQTIYRQLSDSKITVGVKYKTACSGHQYESQMLSKLEATQDLDIQRGFTGYGPHRDDMHITLDNHPADEVGSRGEIRTLLLGLKIVEVRLVEEVRDEKPILLLDDVFSELDGARRMALTEFLAGYQTFITTTDADIVVQHFLDQCHVIPTNKTKESVQ